MILLSVSLFSLFRSGGRGGAYLRDSNMKLSIDGVAHVEWEVG